LFSTRTQGPFQLVFSLATQILACTVQFGYVIHLVTSFFQFVSDLITAPFSQSMPSFSIRAGTGTTLTHWCNAQSVPFIAPLAWLYIFFISVHSITLIRIGYRHKSHAVHAPHIPLWLVTMH